MASQDHYPLALLAAFGVTFVAFGIDPVNRTIWIVESLLVVIAIPVFVATYRRFRFSNLSYTVLFLFLVLHTIGTHFTYSGVPMPDWAERNHYDRVVHFMYGFLMAPLAVELLAARTPPRGMWIWLMPVLFLCSHTAIFEVIEWMLVATLDPEQVENYLCMQDDIWDAQKDMFMAMIGAALGVSLVVTAGKRF